MHEFPGSTRKAAFGAIIVDVDVEPKGNVSRNSTTRDSDTDILSPSHDSCGMSCGSACMGLGFDGPGGATAAMGGAVVRTGIMVESVKWLKNESVGERVGSAVRGSVLGDINGNLRRGGGMRGEDKNKPNTSKSLSFPDYTKCLRTTATWKSQPPTKYLSSSSRRISRHPPTLVAVSASPTSVTT